jgi:hypothetical protein
MPLDDFFADGEADAGAFVFLLAMEALEDDEDALGVEGIDADPVVRRRSATSPWGAQRSMVMRSPRYLMARPPGSGRAARAGLRRRGNRQAGGVDGGAGPSTAAVGLHGEFEHGAGIDCGHSRPCVPRE